MKCTEYEKWISRSLDGDLAPEEEGRLAAHLASCPRCAAFRRDLERIVPELEGLVAPAGVAAEELAGRVLAGLGEQGRGNLLGRHSLLLLGGAGAAAAAVLLLLLFFPGAGGPGPVVAVEGLGVAREGNTYSTEEYPVEGTVATLRLADGSRLELAGETRVSFVDGGGGGGRRLELVRGGLEVQVAPGREPFRVETRAGSVEALGTRFALEVAHYDGEGRKRMTVSAKPALTNTIMTVAVLAGTVMLHTAWGQEPLREGQKRRITTWSLSGRVLDPAGRPVTGARVWADNGEMGQSKVGETPPVIPWRTFRGPARLSNWLWTGSFCSGPFRTDEQGRFRVRNIPSPMQGSLIVLHPDYLERRVPVKREEARPTGDGSLDLGTVRLARGVRLSGRVLRPDGAPLAGARVAVAFPRENLSYQDHRGALRLVRTDREGRFVLQGLDPKWGTLVVGAWSEECYPAERRVEAGSDREGIELVLRLGGRILAAVRSSRGGAPLAGCLVTARPLAGGMGAGLLASARSDREGRAILKGLPPGEYRVAAIPPDQVDKVGRYFPTPWTRSERCRVGGRVTLDLEPPIRVTGRVVEAEGAAPVVDFRLAAYPDPKHFDRSYRARHGHPEPERVKGGEGPAGRFELTCLRPGKWNLEVVADGYHPCRMGLDLAAAGVDDLEIRLRRAGGRIVGRVVDAAGAPLKGVLAEAYEWSPRFYGLNRQKALTGPAGSFALDRLILDEEVVLKVWLKKKGYLRREIKIARGEPRPADLGTVRLVKACRLAGRVTAAAGRPVDRLRVRLQPTTGGMKGGYRTLTDRAGGFAFTDLPAGRYRLFLQGRKVREIDLAEPGAVLQLPPLEY